MSETLVLKAPQAFQTLKVSPYLSIDSDSKDLLQKHFVKLTRKYHPDLLPINTDDQAREEAESKLAELNTSFNNQKEVIRFMLP